MDDMFLNNPLFQGMDPAKLNFIRNFANQSKPQNIKDAMPFLLANMNRAKKENISFSNSEVQFISEILTKDFSEDEKAKVKRIMSMLGR